MTEDCCNTLFDTSTNASIASVKLASGSFAMYRNTTSRFLVSVSRLYLLCVWLRILPANLSSAFLLGIWPFVSRNSCLSKFTCSCRAEFSCVRAFTSTSVTSFSENRISGLFVGRMLSVFLICSERKATVSVSSFSPSKSVPLTRLTVPPSLPYHQWQSGSHRKA